MATRRLYYDDSFLQEFTAHVVRCEPTAFTVSGVVTQAWGVVLDQTAFYPTSGGQPNDLGKLGELNVLDVQDENDEVLHIVDGEMCGGALKGCVNWQRRFDHMQQHTGQHLLSAMFQERFGLPTVSFHLGAEMCSIDLRGPQPTDEILEGAERAASRIVFEDRAVTVRYETQAQLAALRVRKEVEREGILRAIEIEGADLQPCGGTHVNRTGQIGAVLVRRCTKIRQDWRVEFVCGERARSRARHDFVLVQRAAENLGCASEELPSATARALQERDSNYKNGRLLSQRLAAAEATLAVESTPVDEGNGLRVVARLVEGVQPEFMGAFAAELAKKDGSVALLARPESGELFFWQHPGVGRDMAELLKRVLEKAGGKGGGTRDAARGKLADPRKAGEAITWAVGLLKA